MSKVILDECPHSSDLTETRTLVQRVLSILEDDGVDKPGLVSRFRIVENAHRDMCRNIRTIKNVVLVGIVGAILTFVFNAVSDHLDRQAIARTSLPGAK